MLVEHYVLTADPHFNEILEFIRTHDLPCEIHLNRTRFSLDSTRELYLLFLIQYADSCPRTNVQI
jgi:hypothetical protein